MLIASWNVNSINVRLPHILEVLKNYQFDCLALQETKVTDDKFPKSAFEALNYHVIFCGEARYNGVALVTKNPVTCELKSLPNMQDTQQRFLAIDYGKLHVVNVYVPNGEALDSPKYLYKLTWLHHLKLYLVEASHRYPYIAVVGDFNIAPHDMDVHDPLSWQGHVLVSSQERAAFNQLIEAGYIDLYRMAFPDEQIFTWWDYRVAAFRRNMGLRIDHMLVTPSLYQQYKRCGVDKSTRSWERPSDHALIFAEFDL